MRRAPLVIAALAAALLAPAAHAGAPAQAEVVVTLEAPPLATAVAQSRALSVRAKSRRLDLHTPTAASYLLDLGRAQKSVEGRILRAIPSARVRWRYAVVLNGLAVVVPGGRVADLARIPGIARVYPSVRYRPLLDTSPRMIGADQLWGLPDFSSAGNGVKIGIIDQGIDPAHPFFNPAGYVYPPGYPKGDAAYTTPKVIAARAFAPPTTTWKYARLPYDPVYSEHGDHVAGIAAGNYLPGAVPRRGPLSGVAPRAYLGNYKVLTTPSNFGLIENSPEIVAGIEAAVRDGMDVINMSFGEAEIEPTRNLVVAAVNAAADAGVVPVAAAGNSFDELGRGSVASPASAAKAITVAAVSKSSLVASFSSSGPTPISLLLKPDVSAPGVGILSSVPVRDGSWSQFSGTSMASPHVAGAAALLRQRHPDWTVAQIKSALVLTADPVFANSARTAEVPTTRQGAGLIDVPSANVPLVFAAPTSLSLRLMRPGTSASRSIELTDSGGGAGEWTVSVMPQGQAPGVGVAAPGSVTVPGRLDVQVGVAPDAPETDATGFVVLQRGADVRRIAYWLRVAAPRLGKPTMTLAKPGVYSGDTRGKPSRVSAYRYPDRPSGAGVLETLDGPEQVFRVRITKPVANFGVAVLEQARGVRVFPRIVFAGDENRLAGWTALPVNANPYLPTYGRTQPISSVIAPARGSYDVVFDTPSSRDAGRFTFRFWVDDLAPPTARLLTRKVGRTGTLLVSVADAGAGVDPVSLRATLDGKEAEAFYDSKTARAAITLGGRLPPGRHRLVLEVSDLQEPKNMENVAGILPNTRVFRATFTVTR